MARCFLDKTRFEGNAENKLWSWFSTSRNWFCLQHLKKHFSNWLTKKNLTYILSNVLFLFHLCLLKINFASLIEFRSNIKEGIFSLEFWQYLIGFADRNSEFRFWKSRNLRFIENELYFKIMKTPKIAGDTEDYLFLLSFWVDLLWDLSFLINV